MSPEKSLVDFYKLAYLCEVLSSEDLLRMMEVFKDRIRVKSLSHNDQLYLTNAHERAVIRRPSVLRLVDALAKDGMIAMCADSRFETSKDVYAVDMARIKSVVSSSLFDSDRDAMARLKRLFPQIRRMSLTSLVSGMFGDVLELA